MSSVDDRLIDALAPYVARVRTDSSAIRTTDGKVLWRPGEAITRERLAKHLNGGPVRGASLLNADSDVVDGAVLDFDSHKGEVTWAEMAVVVGRVVEVLEMAWGAEPILWRSRGGHGVHLWLMWDGEQRARDVRVWLTGVLAACGLRPGTGGVKAGQCEIFPKQDKVPAGGFGSQVFLPLGGNSAPLRWHDLAEHLEVLPRSAAIGFPAPVSPPVPPAPAREVVERVDNPVDVEGLRAPLQHLADAINTGKAPWGRKQWMDLLMGVHAAGQGGPEAYELAHWFSASTPDWDDVEFDRQWASLKLKPPGEGIGPGTVLHAARMAGWLDPSEIPNPDDFPVVAEGSGSVGVGGAHAASGADGVPERRTIPDARHLCTDQANAVRLVKAYGSHVLVAAGRWHVWDGCRWKADEPEVYRMACRLSAIVKDEARDTLARAKAAMGADGAASRMEQAQKTAEMLEKWSTRCESRATIEAALGLARKMLSVDPASLDASPWLLNCLNGVVDLRTGEIRAARPDDLITKLAPVRYEGVGEDVRCAEWEQAVRTIAGSDAVASFLRRWFGYCSTGDTREQVFVVHWGDGSNGKSTVLGTVARVLGDYAATAAPGLLVGGEKERHPTEIADLQGRRMVTAHETREGVVLRDDFVKQATGGDTLKARYMREDFFEFAPTHKLQLLTNNKPTVRGQDHGIWRRVRLVAYGQRFGSAEDVAAGRATAVGDGGLLGRLAEPKASTGVLAWLVAGAMEWYAGTAGTGGGLREPDAVLEASEAYRSEQDRVRQFLHECCETQRAVQAGGSGGGVLCEALTLGFTGLYPAYVAWAKDGGIHPLSRQKFLAELLRAEPGLSAREEYGKGEGGGRRKIMRIYGVRLLPE
jgi:P4 family phage/plasmid primase-like protien